MLLLLLGLSPRFCNDIAKTNKTARSGLIWLGNCSVNHVITLLYHGHFENHNNSVRLPMTSGLLQKLWLERSY